MKTESALGRAGTVTFSTWAVSYRYQVQNDWDKLDATTGIPKPSTDSNAEVLKALQVIEKYLTAPVPKITNESREAMTRQAQFAIKKVRGE